MRTIKSKDSSATKSNEFTATYVKRDKPKHYINYYERDSNVELGYRTIDDLPEQYITIAQKSPEAADKLFGNPYQRAVYRQLGTTKKESTISVDDF